ncbi:dnaJ-like protein 60 [Diorhabda sublineata]|uniref:dnaJ-like protein 60 n=1 Tax=Diorhabda sublineata TaxID=1163346 RepID=UPI0024E0DCAC|nr:dnaJ-like protein 60 [Diorhabda sublineata]
MYSFSYILIHKSLLSVHSNNYSKSHYDVLNLSRNCTTKQIKESFIKLSKENHPDLNKNKDAHAKFLAINESYRVLSNAQSRRNYDLGLISENNQGKSHPGPNVYTRSCGNDYWSDPTFYNNRDKSKDKFYEERPYYGIRGKGKVSNFTVVAVCIALASFVVGLQALAIVKSTTFQRDKLLEKSSEAEKSLKELKRNVEINGNRVQLEILNMKFAEQERMHRKRH